MSNIAGRRAQTATVPAIINTKGQFIGYLDLPRTKNAPFIEKRLQKFTQLYNEYMNSIEQKKVNCGMITVTLPDGSIREVSKYTTPMEIATSISPMLAKSVIISRISVADDAEGDGETIVAADDDNFSEDEDVSLQLTALALQSQEKWEMFDLFRPLTQSCKLMLLKYDNTVKNSNRDYEPENNLAYGVFNHSCAHILGGAVERAFGSQTTIGPALEKGFYYDFYMGRMSINEDDYKELELAANSIIKENSDFQRLVCTKEEALDLFCDNPFKIQLIANKVPDNACVTVYRNGSFVDLCTGPHIPNTRHINAFKILKHASAYWLGNNKNDSLQRVTGVAFPQEKLLKQHLEFLETAKNRDHRLIGKDLELFFFNSDISPGSCFWLPAGATIYNKLVNLMKQEYIYRGFKEVITPNIFSCDLWKTSGHYDNYKENMYLFNVEEQEWGLKPMNCPGHCEMFKHLSPSYRQLPLRFADFGVLHRNEISGSLTGLTRVRRFQQDDAHIFCTEDQLREEITGALNFLFFIYENLGFTFSLKLSTRPKKAMGSIELWNHAEKSLLQALEECARPWSLNIGDGAFYGPKIDITIKDALQRSHQCGTIQIDFQLPIKFNLQYRTSEETVHNENHHTNNISGQDDSTGLKTGMARPVIVHRAILGSVERMCAVLIEHTGGKLPFWLSPRQIAILPIADRHHDYSFKIRDILRLHNYLVEVDDLPNTTQKKIRDKQLQQWNYMIVIGDKEVSNKNITIRDRDDSKMVETMTVEEFLDILKHKVPPSSRPPVPQL